jgi:hypothetical protein
MGARRWTLIDKIYKNRVHSMSNTAKKNGRDGGKGKRIIAHNNNNNNNNNRKEKTTFIGSLGVTLP